MPASPLPLVLALCWALMAVRAELRAPDLIKNDEAYAAIGEVGRDALELFLAGCASALLLIVVAASVAAFLPGVGEPACAAGGEAEVELQTGGRRLTGWRHLLRI